MGVVTVVDVEFWICVVVWLAEVEFVRVEKEVVVEEFVGDVLVDVVVVFAAVVDGDVWLVVERLEVEVVLEVVWVVDEAPVEVDDVVVFVGKDVVEVTFALFACGLAKPPSARRDPALEVRGDAIDTPEHTRRVETTRVDASIAQARDRCPAPDKALNFLLGGQNPLHI